MSRINRPSKITTMLKSISSEFSADVSMALEAYIRALEKDQVDLLPDDKPMTTPKSIPPVWSHQRVMAREAYIRLRALKKLNHFR